MTSIERIQEFFETINRTGVCLPPKSVIRLEGEAGDSCVDIVTHENGEIDIIDSNGETMGRVVVK